MEPVTWGFVGTLAGALVGATASIATTLVGVWKENNIQEKKHSYERDEKNRAFQRDNLLKIQEFLQQSSRLTARAHLEDREAFRVSGKWGKNKLSESLNDSIHSTNTELTILTERIVNDELRGDVKSFRENLSSSLFSDSLGESEANLESNTRHFMKIMEEIGKELRNKF